MDVIHYKCACCGITMHSKARYGSRKFEGTSINVQAIMSHMLGRITDDLGRPASTLESMWTRPSKEGDEDHNATLVRDWHGNFNPDEQYRKPVYMRTEPCKDLELRLSLPEGDSSREAALSRLDMLLTALQLPDGTKKNYRDEPVNQFGLDERDVKALRCYLTGGHEWIATTRVSVDGTVEELSAK